MGRGAGEECRIVGSYAFAWVFGAYGNRFLATFAFVHASVHRSHLLTRASLHACLTSHRWTDAHRLRDRAELFARAGPGADRIQGAERLEAGQSTRWPRSRRLVESL